MGGSTEATGNYSTSMGFLTEASGDYSTVTGEQTISRLYGGFVQGLYNENYLDVNVQRISIESIVADDRMLAVGVGDDPDGSDGDSDYNDGIGRADGFYVTYRDGTYVREGLTVERFQVNDPTGEYVQDGDGVTQVKTVLSVGREISEGADTSQVLVRNPTTKKLEYVDGSTLLINDRLDVSSTQNTDGSGYYSVDTSSGDVTLTIQTSENVDGKEINVKNNGSGTVTIETQGSSTIDDSTTASIPTNNNAVTLVYNSTNDDWEIY
jgi:hypothetical protein